MIRVKCTLLQCRKERTKIIKVKPWLEKKSEKYENPVNVFMQIL